MIITITEFNHILWLELISGKELEKRKFSRIGQMLLLYVALVCKFMQ